MLGLSADAAINRASREAPRADHVVRLSNGARIAYFEACSAHLAPDSPPVVLVHGSLCDFRYWTPQFEALAAHHRVVAVSLPHYFPVVDQPEGEGFGIQTHVNALVELFESQGWADVVLMGHSRGGCVAFHLACQHPSFLRQLVLVDPGGQPVHMNSTGNGPAPLTLAYPDTDPRIQATRMIEAGKVEEGLNLFVNTVSRPGFWERSGHDFQTMARDNAHTLSMQIRDILPFYTRSAAVAVAMPTLLLNGSKSPLPFLATSDTLERWLPYAQRFVFQGASHGMNLSHAAAFNDQVLKFLSGWG